jgi:uncharacterized membrane protein YedE/YeeE
MTLLYVLFGTVFGFILSRSGASDYDYIQRMFLFEDFHMYGLIGSAIAITAPVLWWLRRTGRTTSGQLLQRATRPRNHGHVAGGLLFGVGWSIAGMCPGPIFVNIGEGKLYALAALAGALVGTGFFGAIYTRLQAPLRLPPLAIGTGEG